MGERVLVLGGAGFIGSNIVKALLEKGHALTVIDGTLSHTSGNLRFIEPYLDQLEFIHSQVEDVKNLGDLCRRSTVIVDSLGLTAHHFGMSHPLVDMRLNLQSHIHVVEAMMAFGFTGRLIYLGSKNQYGVCKDDPITESSPMLPKDVQSIHKQAAEEHFQTFAKLIGHSFVSLRVPNCFGPNQPFHGRDIGLISQFIVRALRGETITVFEGACERKRDIIYAPDLAAIVASIIALPEAPNGCYNVSGHYVGINGLAAEIVRIAGSGKLTAAPMPKNVSLVNLDAAAYDLSRLRALLGGPPEITPLGEALEATIDCFRREHAISRMR